MKISTSEPLRVGLVGISGYGVRHLANLRTAEQEGLARLQAVVVQKPYREEHDEARRTADLAARGVRVYESYEAMFSAERGSLDAVLIPVGIGHHAPMSIAAMRSGFHVYCEKPAAGSYAEALSMCRCAVECKRTLAIGFQNVASASIQRIKQIRVEGELGPLLSARCRVLWPRNAAYYERNAWAGKLSVNGKPIYDSPIQNAASHFLQNLLYVAGARRDESCVPVQIYAENARANAIESADTQFLRVRTAEAVELLFVATHACTEERHPVAEYRFEKGRIEWELSGLTRLYREGSRDPDETWDNEGFDVHYAPFIDFFNAIRESRAPRPTISNSLAHAFCVERAFVSSGSIATVDSEHTCEDPARRLISIRGIEEAVEEACQAGKSFSEQRLPWARPGRALDVEMG
jgi:predicted dehydrogenase